MTDTAPCQPHRWVSKLVPGNDKCAICGELPAHDVHIQAKREAQAARFEANTEWWNR